MQSQSPHLQSTRYVFRTLFSSPDPSFWGRWSLCAHFTGEEADGLAQGYTTIRCQIQDPSPGTLARESWFVNHPTPVHTRIKVPVGVWFPVREWSSVSFLVLVYIKPRGSAFFPPFYPGPISFFKVHIKATTSVKSLQTFLHTAPFPRYTVKKIF